MRQAMSQDFLGTQSDLERRIGRLEREWDANMTEVMWQSVDRTVTTSTSTSFEGGSGFRLNLSGFRFDEQFYGDHFGFTPYSGSDPGIMWPRIGGIYLVHLRGKIVMPSTLDDQPVMVKKLLGKTPTTYASSNEWGSLFGLDYYLNLRHDIREAVTSESRDLYISIEGIGDFLGESDNKPLASGPIDIISPGVFLAWANSVSASFTIKGGDPDDEDTMRLSMSLLAEAPPSAL